MSSLQSSQLSELRIAIIDDHSDIQKALARMLQLHDPMIEIVGIADSAPSGIELLRGSQVDIVFLDIQLAEGTGFHLLDALPDHESRFAVIIMSALDAYALHAHKYGALGYLVKPFDAGELLSALERAVRKVDLMRLAAQAQARANANVPTLLNGTTTASQSETLLHAQLRDASGMIVLAASMIAVCEAFSGYTKCTLVDGVSHLITNTLDDCEKSLTRAEMLRIERGTLINLAYCMGWEADGRNAIALMEGGQRLTVSKRMKSTFVAKMKARAGGK